MHPAEPELPAWRILSLVQQSPPSLQHGHWQDSQLSFRIKGAKGVNASCARLSLWQRWGSDFINLFAVLSCSPDEEYL